MTILPYSWALRSSLSLLPHKAMETFASMKIILTVMKSSNPLFVLFLYTVLNNGTYAQFLSPPSNSTNIVDSCRCQGRTSLINNCGSAITRLPYNIALGDFHHGGPDDIFRLPTTAEYVDCTVTVDLRGDGDQASWASIWSVASTLSIACSSFSRSGGLFTAGFIHAGNTGGIVITMGRAQRLGDENGAAVE